MEENYIWRDLKWSSSVSCGVGGVGIRSSVLWVVTKCERPYAVHQNIVRVVTFNGDKVYVYTNLKYTKSLFATTNNGHDLYVE